jgi:hypothetical protein
MSEQLPLPLLTTHNYRLPTTNYQLPYTSVVCANFRTIASSSFLSFSVSRDE